METIRRWFQQTFSNPQVVILTAILLVAGIAIIATARMLAPVIAGVILAFLLHPPVRWLRRAGMPHLAAVLVVFLLFVTMLLLVIFWLLPMLFQQLTLLVQQVPAMLLAAQSALMQLPERYPTFISEAEVASAMQTLRAEIIAISQMALSYSFSSVVGAVTLLVYCVLLPFLVFFFLRDHERIIAWLTAFLPRERELASRVWAEVEQQMSNYIRGKSVEIVIVAAATFVTFQLLGLNYAALLAVATGLSVLIPYVGAVVVTLPVALVAYAQWGISDDFLYVLIAYAVIQAIDGNVLAPLLLSDAVNIHPVAIIVAILFFGGLWGFWGVFFAIPLATVIQAIINAWPRAPRDGS
ncbi:MAG: AI-2E family transporter [Alphaproteobacteria bacterium]|nr:AI-2E family transporter [Alphaproteobacteria bacterium]